MSATHKTLTFLKKEFLEMLPPSLFFLVVFSVVAFTRSLLAEQYGIPTPTFVAAAVGALIVGKSILIADALPFLRWFSGKRLVYNVAWRTFVYGGFVLLFQFLEEWIPLATKHGGVAAATEHLFANMKWPQFWATSIIVIVFLVIYNVASTAIDAIGRTPMMEIFFGSQGGRAS